METQVFYAWIFNIMEEVGVFSFFLLHPKLKTIFWSLAVIPNVTEVFQCKILYLLY